MASRGRRHRGRPRGASQAPPVSDQRAFVEAIGVAAATLIHASAAENEEGSSDLQGFQAHHPPTCIGGGDFKVRTALTSEREGDDIQGIRDGGASIKMKKDQSSPNLGKKQKTSVSQGSQGQGYGHQGQG